MADIARADMCATTPAFFAGFWQLGAAGGADRHRRRTRRRRRPQCRAKPGARQYRPRFRLLEQHRRLRHQPDADRLFVEHLDIRTRVLGRPAQHVAGRRHRLRARDHLRLHHRHRAAVAKLAGVASGRRLCRAHPQHPAAAANPVLVQRRSQIAAGIARQRRVAVRRLPQQSRPVPAAAGFCAGFRRRRHCFRDRPRRCDRPVSVGAAPSGAHRRAGPHSLDDADRDLRIAAARLHRGRAAAVLRHSRHGPLQYPRRPRNFAGIRSAPAGADALYGGLHRRSGARRRAVRFNAARPKRRRRSACVRERFCAWSWCRRRCGSSSRR